MPKAPSKLVLIYNYNPLHSQSVGAQIAVKGKVSFVGNNAESYEGGALYLSAFGQVELYRGSHIDFVENRGR